MDTPQKFTAASIPRFIRTSRLWYLRFDTIIGSRMIKHEGQQEGVVYDIIMLPSNEFTRARAYLGVQNMGNIALELFKVTPAYVPQDAQEITVPDTEPDPRDYALKYFLKAFDLPDTSVAG